MRKHINEFVRICSKNLNLKEPVYEFGSFIVEGQEDIGNLRVYFPGKDYTGFDMTKGKGVDKIENLHHLTLEDESASTILCFETFEHVKFPFKAIDEVHRVLKKDGVLLFAVPFAFPIHAYPDDYYRYTPSGVSALLKKFDKVYTFSVGLEFMPHNVLAIAVKGEPPQELLNLLPKLKKWKSRYKYDWKVALTPPILHNYYKKLKEKNK
jgi:SAM-dependent methyltransferase